MNVRRPFTGSARSFVVAKGIVTVTVLGVWGVLTADVRAAESPHIYWSMNGIGVSRAVPPCFAPLEHIVTLPTNVGGRQLAVDPINEKLYYIEHTNAASNSGLVRRADLDGSSPITIASGLGNVYGLGIDAVANKVCWGDAGNGGSNNGTITCSDLDGGNAAAIVNESDTPIESPSGIEIHNGKVYWSDWDHHWIKRANLARTAGQLDTSDIEVVANGLCNPYGFALDLVNNRIYTANVATTGCELGRIQRVQFLSSDLVLSQVAPGQPIDLVVSNPPAAGMNPFDIALDPVNQRIYWTSENGGISRSDLDGSGVEFVVATDPAPDDKPEGIALSGPISLNPCPACGDGVAEGAECCDLGGQNGQVGSLCSATCECIGTCTNGAGATCGLCVSAGDCTGSCDSCCGDGVVDPGEDCDDGNLNSDDCCTNLCKDSIDPICPPPCPGLRGPQLLNPADMKAKFADRDANGPYEDWRIGSKGSRGNFILANGQAVDCETDVVTISFLENDGSGNVEILGSFELAPGLLPTGDWDKITPRADDDERCTLKDETEARSDPAGVGSAQISESGVKIRYKFRGRTGNAIARPTNERIRACVVVGDVAGSAVLQCEDRRGDGSSLVCGPVN